MPRIPESLQGSLCGGEEGSSSAISENPREGTHLPSRNLPAVTEGPKAGHPADTGGLSSKAKKRRRGPIWGEEIRCKYMQNLW